MLSVTLSGLDTIMKLRTLDLLLLCIAYSATAAPVNRTAVTIPLGNY